MEKKRIGLLTAYKLFFKNYANFRGRSTRAEYWWAVFVNFVINLLLLAAFLLVLVSSIHSGDGGRLVWLLPPLLILVIFDLGIFIPKISLTVRRYRDAGVNPWLVLLTNGLPYVLGLITGGSTASHAQSTLNSASTIFGGTVGLASQIVILACTVIDLFILLRPSKFTVMNTHHDDTMNW